MKYKTFITKSNTKLLIPKSFTFDVNEDDFGKYISILANNANKYMEYKGSRKIKEYRI